jgi:hypothetical protein
MTQFIMDLKELPWPIVYITLHYLMNNNLNFNLKESNREYYEWIISIFEIIRFFCCLATIDKIKYDAIITVLNNSREPPLGDLVRGWEDFIGV